jgi:hypothetical protein
MGAYDSVWRILASRSLAVGSSGAVVASTAALSNQTRVVQLVWAGPVFSTAGIRFAIGDVGSTVVHSTTSPLLPPNVIGGPYLVSPGQQIAALSNDASAVGNLTIIELGK